MKWAKRQKLSPMLFPGAPVTADGVAITFYRRNPFARYPASEADLRAILSRLPAGVLDGLNSISLSLGTEYQRDKAEEWNEQDPVVGRFGDERLPGVYCGLIPGVYFGYARRIQVYGFVSAEPVAEPWTLYLRLHMLATLVHEVAHHEDLTKGWARDRWIGDDKHKTEWYAESRQLLWVETVVIPYLQKAYSAEVALLEKWMQERIDLVLPLRVLAGDARIRAKKQGMYYWRNTFGSSADAFEQFVRAVNSGNDITEARLDLAIGLHRAEELDYAQEIIAVILAEHPDHVPTLVQKGWICREQKRYEEALNVLQRANRLEPGNSEVWQEMAHLYADIGVWGPVIVAASQAIKTASDRLVQPGMREVIGRAYIGLGDFDNAPSVIAEFTGTGKPWDARAAARLQTLLDEALASKSILARGEANGDQN
jgi:tetratricopeptide (TPR) repeat protein